VVIHNFWHPINIYGESSDGSLNQLNRKHSLEIAEYTTIGIAAIGSIVATISSQIAYAIVPMTATLCLSAANRSRVQKQQDRSTVILAQSFNQSSTNSSIEDLKLIINDLQAQIVQVADRKNQLAETNEIAKIRTDLNRLIQAVDATELNPTIKDELNSFRATIQASIETQNRSNHEYSLIIGRKESRQVLIQALQNTEHRLILVCPWLMTYALNSELKLLFDLALAKGVSIDVSWGHLSDLSLQEQRTNNIKFLSNDEFCQKVIANKGKTKFNTFYGALPYYLNLEQQFPTQFKLRLLGTHEKFLVSDSNYAVIGSHNFLSSGDSSGERELGLKTNDPQIVSSLIKYYETSHQPPQMIAALNQN
jgi:PLD-like domain